MYAASTSAFVVITLALAGASAGQGVGPHAGASAMIRSDTGFARSVAQKNRAQFLSFIAEATTFNGGTLTELRGRDAVMKEWSAFFEPNGPTLTWEPVSGAVIGASDVGYTVGHSLFRQKASDGSTIERRGEYLTVWRKQPDSSWKVAFDTGSTLLQ